MYRPGPVAVSFQNPTAGLTVALRRNDVTDSAPGPDRPIVHAQFRSSDADEVEEFIRATYVDVRIRPADDRPFECGHDVVGTPDFSISQVWVTAVLRASVGPTEGAFVVEQIHDGGMVWDHPDHGELCTGPGSCAVLPRSGEHADLIDQLEFDIITLDESAMARYVADVHGLAPDALTLTGLAPVSDARRRAWNATVARVRDEMLGNPLLIDTPIGLDAAFRTLAASFLTTFPTAGRETIEQGPQGRVDGARLRQATDYLTAHAGRPVSPGELARITGLPVAHLTAAMRRQRDTSPALVLWRARLHGLYRDLRAAEPGPDPDATLAAHASRWGFTHPGRLRVAYARTLGEFPEQTLRR